MACWPSLQIRTAFLIHLEKRTGSLSITIALHQSSWSVRADLLISWTHLLHMCIKYVRRWSTHSPCCLTYNIICSVLICTYFRRDAGTACENGNVRIDNMTGIMDNLQHKASCPWTYEVSYDRDRLPPELIVARCQTISYPSSPCKSVLYWVPVTRWNRARGNWTDTWDLVTVGCSFADTVDYVYTSE